jgi:tRNA (guanine-N7-)-methyltransferase
MAMDPTDGTADGRRTLYGRRRGRPLRPNRQALVDRLLPRLAVDPDALPGDPLTLFPEPVRDLWVEVGFGGGEHLLEQAMHHPEIGFIGCEPFLNGVAKLLSGIEAAAPPPRNIRLYTDDARALLDALPDASVGRVFVLFPDPWPKTRHHRRRFIAPPQLDTLARIMRPGAELRLATDHVDYLRWMLFHLLAHPAFRWCARGPDDWRRRPADWPPTRYEEKALEKGLRPAYLRFERRGPTSAANRQ